MDRFEVWQSDLITLCPGLTLVVEYLVLFRTSALLVAIAISTPNLATADDSMPFDWKKHALAFYGHFDEGREVEINTATPHEFSIGNCTRRGVDRPRVKVRDIAVVLLESKEKAFPNTSIAVYEIVDRKALDKLSTGKCWQRNQAMVHIEVGSSLVVMSGLCRGVGYWRYDVDDFLTMVEAAGHTPKNIWVARCGGLSRSMTSKEVHRAGKRVSSQWKKPEPANRNALKAAAKSAKTAGTAPARVQ